MEFQYSATNILTVWLKDDLFFEYRKWELSLKISVALKLLEIVYNLMYNESLSSAHSFLDLAVGAIKLSPYKFEKIEELNDVINLIKEFEQHEVHIRDLYVRPVLVG